MRMVAPATFRGPGGAVLLLGDGATVSPAAPVEGSLRYNYSSQEFEGFSTAWGALGGSGSGDVNLDGGSAGSVYTSAQLVDGGAA